jgi:hypothetical protein
VVDRLVVEGAAVEVFTAFDLVVVDVESNRHGVSSWFLDADIIPAMKAFG